MNENVNVDGIKHLSENWSGHTRFRILQKHPPKSYACTNAYFLEHSGFITTSQCLARSMSPIPRSAQLRAKQHWEIEKEATAQDALQLSGIHVDPHGDEEFDDIIGHARMMLT